MKILITGGSGFVGTNLTNRLIERGYEVVVVDIVNFNGKFREKINFYNEDVTNHEKLLEIFEKEKPEIVFHLSANVKLRESFKRPLHDAHQNILGTISVLECCRKYNVKKIIYASSIARIGNPKYIPIDEKHDTNPCSPYGLSKHIGEKYIKLYHEIYGLDYFIFCFGNVYGPEDNPETKRVIPLFIKNIRDNQTPKIFGDGNQTRDFIYVLDLVDFLIDSIGKESSEKLFHLSKGDKVSVNEIFAILKECSGFEKESEHIEEPVKEVRDLRIDTTLVREKLGWNPKTNIDAGLRETWNWFQSQ